MEQLKMFWFPGTPIWDGELPEGYSFSNYKDESDIYEWASICRHGLLGEGDPKKQFKIDITDRADLNPSTDLFFLDYEGNHIGTITAYVCKDTRIGDVHMVALKEEYCGKGLSKYMLSKALSKLSKEDMKYAFLTTDEWRVPAVKGYLKAGFLPVEYDYCMVERWEAMLETCGIEEVQMVYNDGTPYRKITRSSKAIHTPVKFAVLGAGRGQTMMNYCVGGVGAKLVAVCDRDQSALDKIKEKYGDVFKAYTDFDTMLAETDADCIVLANDANRHVPFAIKALRAGKHVLSEVLPVQTMKEAVELIETVEETGKIYAYAENYCFMRGPKMIRQYFREGKLGHFEYGEGEYMHNCEPDWDVLVHNTPNHWRNIMNAFYYCTHSLGPLIHIAGKRPVSVTGFEGPRSERMERMGALGGAFAVEMVTLEDGAILKSLHGVGISRNSIWYSCYGTEGRAETAREDSGDGGTHMFYLSYDEEPGDNDKKVQIPTQNDGLIEKAAKFNGHGGSDYYIMYNLIEAIKGNKQADIIDVYEALDMFLPGMFAYRSVLAGGIPMAIPDLRDKNEREKWRNDTECNDPEVAGDMLIPCYSKGNAEVPADTWIKCRARQDRAKAKLRARAEQEAKEKSE